MTRDEESSNIVHSDASDRLEQAEGPTAPDSAVDAWLADDTVVATRDEESATIPAEPDLVSAWLLRVALALIVVVLATSGSLVIFFVTAAKAPRTAVERDVAAAEVAVRERASDPGTWQTLAYAYVRAERFDDAVEVSRRGRTATAAKVLLLSEADALRSAGRHKDAIAVYDEAVTALSQEESAAAVTRKRQGIAASAPSSSLVTAFYGRALSRSETGDAKGAIADVKQALEFGPQQSSLLTTLGQLYEKTGETAKAKAAYREALRFIPDYPEALLGLKRLEKRP